MKNSKNRFTMKKGCMKIKLHTVFYNIFIQNSQLKIDVRYTISIIILAKFITSLAMYFIV